MMARALCLLQVIVALLMPVPGRGDDGYQASEDGAAFKLLKGSYLRSQSSGAHCGIYSLAGAMKALGQTPRMEELLSSDYISSPRGSSADDLVRAATRYGLVAVAIKGGSLTWLRGKSNPVLLRLSNSHRAEGTFHWVVYLGDDKGKAIIFDAPREPQPVGYASLLALWDGRAVVVSRHSDERWLGEQVTAVLGVLVWMGAACVAVVALGLLLHAAPPRFARSWFAQAAGLLVAGCLLGLAVHTVSRIGFFSSDMNGRVARLAQVHRGSGAAPDLPTISTPALQRLLNDPAVQVIDARTPQAFSMGHVSGAINFPVDASLSEFEEATERLNPDRRMVVYCQGESCAWADDVAATLELLGYPKPVVYRAGWQGWVDAGRDEQ